MWLTSRAKCLQQQQQFFITSLFSESPFFGVLDAYSGASGLGQDYQYNYSQILSSPAYHAIRSVMEAENELTETQIQQIRDVMTIRCDGDTLDNDQRPTTCYSNSPCLVNLNTDPCETTNLAQM